VAIANIYTADTESLRARNRLASSCSARRDTEMWIFGGVCAAFIAGALHVIRRRVESVVKRPIVGFYDDEVIQDVTLRAAVRRHCLEASSPADLMSVESAASGRR
jgi:hypothetical protein